MRKYVLFPYLVSFFVLYPCGLLLADFQGGLSGRDVAFELIEYAGKGDLEGVKSLIESGVVGPDAQSRTTVRGATALAMATRSDKPSALRVIDYLISKGVEIDKPALQGRTALMEAAQQGNVDAVKLLLASGADVDKALKLYPSQMARSFAERRKVREGDSYDKIVKLLDQWRRANQDERNSLRDEWRKELSLAPVEIREDWVLLETSPKEQQEMAEARKRLSKKLGGTAGWLPRLRSFFRKR